MTLIPGVSDVSETFGMRFFSILAALVVSAALYLVIFDRPTLLSWIGAEPVETAQSQDGETLASAQIAAAPDTAGLVKVVVQRSEAKNIDTAVILRGQTNAARQVEVRAETSAPVLSEPLRKGAEVSAGQTLCELDPGTRGASLLQAQAQLDEARARVPEAEARVAQAQAQLEEARINQNASARLSEGGFASTVRVAGSEAAVATALASVESARAGLQSAQAGIQSAQAAVAAAELEIKHLTITAPFAGLLQSDTAELGELLQPGALCATVIQLDPIKLVGFVPETEVARVTVGAMATARLATGQQDVTGRVTFLSRTADETTRTFLVEIDVPNPDKRISDGQTAEIMIASDGAKAHLLPQSALTLNDDGVLGVRTIDDANTVEFHAVTLMRDTAQGVWLTGLDDVANVIVLGQEYVIAGVTVDPTFRELGQ
jgi:multidrug efflux system membrane fusion protein